MIKHIVMWRLQDGAEGQDVKKYCRKIKETLEALREKIPQVQHLEVGVNITDAEYAADVVLYTEFATKEDLDLYQEHPDHKAVVPFLKAIAKERRFVDYETK
jgi:hypothetical protein